MMSEHDLNYEERRNFERKYLIFYLRVFDGFSNKVVGHAVNLSSSGIMLLSDAAIILNEDYRLRMRFPSSATEKSDLLFNATSRWSQKDSNPDFFLTGFQIYNLKPRDQESIINLLEEFSFIESAN